MDIKTHLAELIAAHIEHARIPQDPARRHRGDVLVACRCSLLVAQTGVVMVDALFCGGNDSTLEELQLAAQVALLWRQAELRSAQDHAKHARLYKDRPPLSWLHVQSRAFACQAEQKAAMYREIYRGLSAVIRRRKANAALVAADHATHAADGR